MTKVCLLKLKIDTLLASNLSKTATSFLDKQAKLEKLIFIVIKINIENFVNAI